LVTPCSDSSLMSLSLSSVMNLRFDMVKITV
jgi:hypothetical protein